MMFQLIILVGRRIFFGMPNRPTFVEVERLSSDAARQRQHLSKQIFLWKKNSGTRLKNLINSCLHNKPYSAGVQVQQCLYCDIGSVTLLSHNTLK